MKKRYGLLAVLLSITLFSGCALQNASGGTQNGGQAEADVAVAADTGSGTTTSSVGVYDSVDTAIVVKTDTQLKTISLRNLETGRQYTLTYTGTSVLSDRNGEALTMAQVAVGTLVDVTFLRTKKTLTTLQESSDAFVYRSVSDFQISESGRSMTIGGTEYRLSSGLLVAAEDTIGTLMDINQNDVLIVRGFDREVHSIVIERGHGYLRLANDESFIGGWIEVGSHTIVPITENMLLTVPEGTYNVSVSCGRSGGTKSITIVRNEEQIMDVGDLVVEVKEGGVLFDVTPSSASVYVDGEKIDTSEVVMLAYGIHQVILKADGYVTLTKYISVGQEMATLLMEMEKSTSSESSGTEDDEDDDEDDAGSDTDQTDMGSSASGSDTNQTDTSSNTTGSGDNGNEETGNGTGSTETAVSPSDGTSYYVSIEGPVGAEVYVDGNYIGLAPVRFKKTEGSHEITLRQTGYQTRSYTIELDDEKKDVSYTFSDLQAITQ